MGQKGVRKTAFAGLLVSLASCCSALVHCSDVPEQAVAAPAGGAQSYQRLHRQLAAFCRCSSCQGKPD